MKRFIIHITRLSGESGAGLNSSKNGLRKQDGQMALGFIVVRGWAWSEASQTES